MHLQAFMKEELPSLREALLAPFHSQMTKLEEAMLYSLNGGGKSLRPLLVLAVLKTFAQRLSGSLCSRVSSYLFLDP